MTDTVERSGVIYRIKCVANGRAYIGSSVNVKRRFYLHCRDLVAGTHHSPRLQNAWNKYGSDAFVFEVVEHVADALFLVAREQFWIWEHEASLLNCSMVAGSPLGVKRTNEQRLRMSEAKKAAAATPEGAARLAKIREKLTGRVVTDEERARRSASAIGKYRGEWTPERRAAHSTALTGRKMPPSKPERGQRISAATKGKRRSPEAIAASVASRLKFIESEVDQWIELHAAGHSFRSIEKIVGRCRDVIAREVRARA
jgi:group I intron endonuclease